MNKIVCIALVICTFCCAVQAQEKKYVYQDSTLLQQDDFKDTAITVEVPTESTVAETSQTDTTISFSHLKISPDTIHNWQNLKAFAYAKYLDSLLKVSQEKKQASEPVSTPSSSGPGWLDGVLASQGTKVFFWTLAGIFVLFILYKLFLTQGVFRRDRTIKETGKAEVEEETITSDSDFDALIRQAASTGNYRLAVRYMYLKTLHKLADKDRIHMAADKTNYQYVQEINDTGLRNEFAGLTLSYEYVWYGEFAIEENIYQKLQAAFSNIDRKL